MFGKSNKSKMAAGLLYLALAVGAGFWAWEVVSSTGIRKNGLQSLNETNSYLTEQVPFLERENERMVARLEYQTRLNGNKPEDVAVARQGRKSYETLKRLQEELSALVINQRNSIERELPALVLSSDTALNSLYAKEPLATRIKKKWPGPYSLNRHPLIQQTTLLPSLFDVIKLNLIISDGLAAKVSSPGLYFNRTYFGLIPSATIIQEGDPFKSLLLLATDNQRLYPSPEISIKEGRLVSDRPLSQFYLKASTDSTVSLASNQQTWDATIRLSYWSRPEQVGKDTTLHIQHSFRVRKKTASR